MSLPTTTDAVVAWLLGPGHLSCLDTDGHPLGEQASPRYARTARDEQHRTFGDARDKVLMPCNVGALAQVRSSWPFVLDTLRAVDRDRPPTFGRALRRAEMGATLAPLVALRGEAVAPHLAALYKATLGFGEVLVTVLLEGWADADDPPDEARFFGWLDARPFLIGERQVCAGTRAQLRRVFHALADDPAPSEHASDPVSASASSIEELRTLHALVAAAAGAARPHLVAGRGDRSATCARLYEAREVPSRAEGIRQIAEGSALHATLLFGAADVPAELRGFVSALPAAAVTSDPLAAIDALLLAGARTVASRLMTALGRVSMPLSLAGMHDACVDGP